MLRMISKATHLAHPAGGKRREWRKASAEWLLSLAAAPTFAIVALLAGFLDGRMPDALCSATHGASPLTGMIPMYLLMSVFHSAPWLRLLTNWRGGASRKMLTNGASCALQHDAPGARSLWRRLRASGG
jgi:hypothetical protein